MRMVWLRFARLGTLLACGVLAFAATAPQAEAAERAEKDTVFAETAATLEPGATELELGLAYTKQGSSRDGLFSNDWGSRGRTGFDRIYDWSAELRAGVEDDFDLALRWGWTDLKDRGRPFEAGHGRGLDDLEVELGFRFYDEDGLSLAYRPGVTLPIGRDATSGRIGSGQNFFSLDQRLVLTQDAGDLVVNADVGYSLPFARTRNHYSQRFRTEARNTRGIADGNLALSYRALPAVKPEVGLRYAHEFISSGNDSDLLEATVGAVIPLDDGLRAKVGLAEPFAGRNAVRARTVTGSVVLGF